MALWAGLAEGDYAFAMSDDSRTFEELKAEQDAYWAEVESMPAPPGYDEYVRAMIDEGLREMEKPGAVFYSQQEMELIMAEHRLTRRDRTEEPIETQPIPLAASGISLVEDTRTLEEVKAEQDALWAEIESKPSPQGYDEYVRAIIQEGIDYCNRPDAVFYTQEQIEAEMAEQRRRWQLDERKTA